MGHRRLLSISGALSLNCLVGDIFDVVVEDFELIHWHFAFSKYSYLENS